MQNSVGNFNKFWQVQQPIQVFIVGHKQANYFFIHHVIHWACVSDIAIMSSLKQNWCYHKAIDNNSKSCDQQWCEKSAFVAWVDGSWCLRTILHSSRSCVFAFCTHFLLLIILQDDSILPYNSRRYLGREAVFLVTEPGFEEIGKQRGFYSTMIITALWLVSVFTLSNHNPS